jgi:transcriptional regulator with XRE-family HTH domain
MEGLLGNNIRYLRKSKGLTQDQLADKIGVNRAMIGSYEEGRAVPKLSAMSTLAHYFGVSLDAIATHDLSQQQPISNKSNTIDTSGKSLRVLSTIVDRNNRELITMVPVKASAGYLNGYADPDFIEALPRFHMPFPELGLERTYRAFQISGKSMEPVPSGSYIICEYLQNWDEIRDSKAYIIITQNDGIVYKRIFRKDSDMILLKSDNPEYEPYEINVHSVTEIWRALGFISFTLPEPDELSMGKLSAMMTELKNEINNLKKVK